MKYIIALLALMPIFLNASAQTELTTDMVWQDGTHWIYPFEDMHDLIPGNYFLSECKLLKKYNEETKEYYLSVYSRAFKPGERESDWIPLGQYLKIEGNTVYGFLPDYTDNQYDDYLYQMYDFSTWKEGETIVFERADLLNYTPKKSNIILGNCQRIVTDPEGNYYSYAFSGLNGNKQPYYYIKSIGRVQDSDITSLVYFFMDYPMCNVYGKPDGIMALKVWHPDLGVLYQHPDYEHVMELAGVDSLTADEAMEAVVMTGSGEVTVESAQPVEVMICTTTGVTVRRDRVIGSATYPLAPGIYIVRAGSRTCKVCI